jgi:hypothetical protein
MSARRAELALLADGAGMIPAARPFFDNPTLRQGLVESRGMTPLVFLMGVMGDDRHALDLRVSVAQSLLPYYHRRQSIMAEIDITSHNTVAQQLELVYGIDDPQGISGDASN